MVRWYHHAGKAKSVASQKEWVKLQKAAKAQGWTVEQGTKHLRLVAPNGKFYPIARSSHKGSGSRRAILNALSDMAKLDPSFDKRKVKVS